LMILAPERDAEEARRTAEVCMQRAGRAVTGFDLTVEPTTVHWTKRYMSEKPEAQATWQRTMTILAEIEGSGSHENGGIAPAPPPPGTGTTTPWH
jgi:hypothetical protein